MTTSRVVIDHPADAGGNELSSPPGAAPGNSKGRRRIAMEGLAISPDGRKLFGIMQNARIQDHALNQNNNRRGFNNRILEVDVTTGATRELLYRLDNRDYGVNEILAINDHQFLVIEREGNAGMREALFLDLLAPGFGLAGASFPEKIEGLAFGPDLTTAAACCS
jgi:hypothetical protein